MPNCKTNQATNSRNTCENTATIIPYLYISPKVMRQRTAIRTATLQLSCLNAPAYSECKVYTFHITSIQMKLKENLPGNLLVDLFSETSF